MVFVGLISSALLADFNTLPRKVAYKFQKKNYSPDHHGYNLRSPEAFKSEKKCAYGKEWE